MSTTAGPPGNNFFFFHRSVMRMPAGVWQIICEQDRRFRFWFRFSVGPLGCGWARSRTFILDVYSCYIVVMLGRYRCRGGSRKFDASKADSVRKFELVCIWSIAIAPADGGGRKIGTLVSSFRAWDVGWMDVFSIPKVLSTPEPRFRAVFFRTPEGDGWHLSARTGRGWEGRLWGSKLLARSRDVFFFFLFGSMG